VTPSGDGTVNSRVRAYARRRAGAPRQLDSWNALDLNGKMQRGPLKSMGPEAESYTRPLQIILARCIHWIIHEQHQSFTLAKDCNVAIEGQNANLSNLVS
jgi:hypothetical protein